MTGWASWQVALVIASFLAAMFLAGAAVAAVKINTPEPRHAADDETAEWMHRLVGPARVMADPVLARLALLGRVVAATARGDVMACGCRPGGPSCTWWAEQPPLIVSGPAAVPDPPAAEPSPPRGGAAGPETPSWQAGDRRGEARGEDRGMGADRVKPSGSQRPEPLHSEDPGLPPVDQAAHPAPGDAGDLDDTGYLARLTEWALTAPLDQVTASAEADL